MNILFSQDAWQQYLGWQSDDAKILNRINELLKATQRDPFRGIGKPEPLRQNYKGFWSRRITKEHRFIYRIVGSEKTTKRIEVLSCKFHYEKK